jgi:hypothetical protein
VKRHAAMRAGVLKSEGSAIAVAANHERRFQEHRFVKGAPANLVGRQSAIPEAGEHQGIWDFTLRRVNG